jgi:hypothetical protein
MLLKKKNILMKMKMRRRKKKNKVMVILTPLNFLMQMQVVRYLHQLKRKKIVDKYFLVLSWFELIVVECNRMNFMTLLFETLQSVMYYIK